ncbi:hypothetical protein AQ490_19765 [Wenjunlia vitaminophila]|uniref:Acyl-CoA carboxylase subunit epsilon n=1 Tax=Wenjunlia vitaminophila TaxID=76728 RepID=A0A0T6LV25_WENVI|nr:acyl-CoA carboxylase subunit epsilon [Wenjunlia vitaminophila]KRV49682.1 hypothetical protein AQ490_19765 [Wenjunlia vitaminophila]
MAGGSAPTGSQIGQLFRVERGEPAPEELAALTAVLCARLAPGQSGGAGTAPRRAVAPWRRPERAAMFECPRTWRAGGRAPG